VPIYFYTWHVLKAWCLRLMEKIKNNEMQHPILDDLHIVMYMPMNQVKALKPSWLVGETRSLKISHNIYLVIHGFDIFGPIISKLVRELIHYFVAPCYAYPKIFILWIKVKTPIMDLAIPCGC
jgi:hypothetical protein